MEKSERATILGSFVDDHVEVQKLRVSMANRIGSLKRQEKAYKTSLNVLKATSNVEELLERYISEEFQKHPAFPWTSKIWGCGMEAAAKPIGIIDGVIFKSTGRSGIEAFDTPSKLRRFCGLAVVDEHAEKVKKGEVGIHYNKMLRTLLWRLLLRLMQQRRFYCPKCQAKVTKKAEKCQKCSADIKDNKTLIEGVWLRRYKENVTYYEQRCERDGIKIMPTPLHRLCPKCKAEKKVPKTTRKCPECGAELMLKGEPPGILFRGHLDNMAKRRTIRLWVDCLWLVWRAAEGLPLRAPYPIEHQDHITLISPWEMIDRD
jgi:hypothetical protein